MTLADNSFDSIFVIGRFQVHSLHEGHRVLLDTATRVGKRLFILVGIHGGVQTEDNPLDFATRQKMIQADYPGATIMPLWDEPTNNGWSNQVDRLINSCCPTGSVALMGSRDSFIPGYLGSHHTIKIEPLDKKHVTGTDLRNLVGFEPLGTEDFRRGVTYAHKQSRPQVIPTVDAAIVEKMGGMPRMLLGQKLKDPNKFRLIGGFVDPDDGSLEQTIAREVSEETGLECGGAPGFSYIGSYTVPDWRLSGRTRIMTSLFTAEKHYGALKAGDDMDALEWFHLDVLAEKIASNGIHFADGHRLLVIMAIIHLKKKYSLNINPTTLEEIA